MPKPSNYHFVFLFVLFCVIVEAFGKTAARNVQRLVDIETRLKEGKLTSINDKQLLHTEKSKLVKDVMGVLNSPLAGHKIGNVHTSGRPAFLRFQGTSMQSGTGLRTNQGLMMNQGNPEKTGQGQGGTEKDYHYNGSPCDEKISNFMACTVRPPHNGNVV